MSAVLAAPPASPAGPSPELVEAAKEALAAHDALLASDARDTFANDAFGLPVERARWVQWYELDYRPTCDAWVAAMDRLAILMGSDFPGRLPEQFRPVCDGVIREDTWWTRSGLMGGMPRVGKAFIRPEWLDGAESND